MASREAACREPHTMRRHRRVGMIGGERPWFGVSVGHCDPVIIALLLPDAVLQTHGCSCFSHQCHTRIVMAKLSRFAWIDHGPL